MLDITNLPDDVEALKAMILERDARIAAQALTIAALQKIAFGKSSEKRPTSAGGSDAPGQGWLFYTELIAEAERTANAKDVKGTIEVTPHKRRKAGGRRSAFPDHLPRVTTTYELPEDQRQCPYCYGPLHEIGFEICKELERLETAIVHEIRRQKYACRGCTDGVTTAPGPDRPIEKGILGPGYLASVAVERFGNSMPYNRLEKKYATEGLDLSRSVLQRSMAKCAELLEPIHVQLRAEIIASPEIFTDDTPVTIAQPFDGGKSKQGRVWIYADREGRLDYDFTNSRRRDGPQSVLGSYTGFIHADAYPGYDQLFLPSGAKEVACWAHARRKFVEAEQSEPELAAEAIERIKELYAVEKYCKLHKLDEEDRLAIRVERSIPVLDELFAWMALKNAEVLPKSPMSRALNYALKLEEALRRYTTNGRLEIDNNRAERALRSVAVGRKNWMFFLNENGGHAAKVMLSLVMTAKTIGLDPRTYVRDVLVRIAREGDIAKLTPHGWKMHFQAEVEQQRQDAMQAIVRV